MRWSRSAGGARGSSACSVSPPRRRRCRHRLSPGFSQPSRRPSGIDRQRLYHIARGDDDEGRADGLRRWGLGTLGLGWAAPGGIKHPSHLLSDVADAALGGEPCAFVLAIRDPLEQPARCKEHWYEAATKHEAAEIVAKIQFLIKLHSESLKLSGGPAAGAHSHTDGFALGAASGPTT